MERLTKKLDGSVVFPKELVGVTVTPDNSAMCALLCRLAAYEDTGLMPEEIKELLHETTGPLHRKLGEWIDADKDGRLVVLPCKPGDTVYSIFGAEVIEKTVGRVIINGYTIPRIWVDLDCSFLSSVTKRWDLGIGKDFFLTREEAEKALEVMKK